MQAYTTKQNMIGVALWKFASYRTFKVILPYFFQLNKIKNLVIELKIAKFKLVSHAIWIGIGNWQ